MIRKKIGMIALAAMLSIPMATTTLPATVLAEEGNVQTDSSALVEGTYDLPVSLVNATDHTAASMAAPCLTDNATLEVDENGNQTVTISIGGLPMGTTTYYCNSWSIYPGSDLTVDPTAAETTLDENNNVDSITFAVPDSSLGGVYVKLAIDINGRSMTPNAFIAFDYDNATEIIDTESLIDTIDEAAKLNEADYTIASWADLQTALTAAEAQKSAPTHQTDIDAAEDALIDAMENLVPQTGIGSANVSLAAGTYTVPAALMNASDISKASMAASCIAGDATLTVAEDGTLTATVPIQAVTVRTVTAYATEFKIYSGAVGSDTTTAASTTDENGNLNSITFTIPNKAADGVYVNIVVGSMMSPDAFIKFDYASAKAVVNTDTLTSAVEAAEALDSSKYTADSWKAVEDALAAAKEAISAGESQEAIDAAIAALNDAVNALTEVKNETPETTKLAITKGKTYTVSGRKYKVTKAAKTGSTVTFTGITSKKATSVVIPATVKIKGVTCKVTAINAKALKNNKKIKKVTIGSNVTSIGSYAFYGCKNLKKITVKSAKLKTVGKKSLSKINKKAVIKVPKTKLKAYKKLFKGKGQAKTVKIK